MASDRVDYRHRQREISAGDLATIPHYTSLGLRAKRFVDAFVALVLIVMLSPVFLTVGIAILLASRQSPLYLDERVGRSGKHFKCWKFQTMLDAPDMLAAYLADHPDEAEQYRVSRKLTNDPRVTPVGNFLRRSSLDELPQLFNVLRGDMSLVGPRPISEREFIERGEDGAVMARVRPGMTGLWQVSGRSDVSPEYRIALDNRYVYEWSLALDAQILLRTPLVVLGAGGAR